MKKDAEAKQTEGSWQSELLRTKQQCETSLKELESRTNVELAERESHRLAAETALQEHLRQMESSSSSAEELEKLQAEVNDLRRLYNYFKSNSERLTRQIKTGGNMSVQGEIGAGKRPVQRQNLSTPNTYSSRGPEAVRVVGAFPGDAE